VLALNIALFAQSLPEAINEQRRWRPDAQEADTVNRFERLRVGRERPRSAAKSQDKVAPPHMLLPENTL
jgi:hypothetical protein